MSATYPKIKDLEVNLLLLKRSEVVVTEKIHGANFRILIPAGAAMDKISFGAKGSLIKKGSFFAQFIEDIQSQLPLDNILAGLDDKRNWTLFGELFGPRIQKEIPYLREGVGIRFFDVMRNDELLKYDEFTELAGSLSLPTAPELHRGIPRMSVFQQLVCEPSSVGENAPREGIVIRDPSLDPIDGQLPLAKFKNEPFREKSYSVSVEAFTRLADEEEKVRLFVKNFVTETRIRKMADVLREQGRLTRSHRDIPALTSELIKDIQAEDAEYRAELEERMMSRIITQRVNRIFSVLLRKGVWDSP